MTAWSLLIHMKYNVSQKRSLEPYQGNAVSQNYSGLPLSLQYECGRQCVFGVQSGRLRRYVTALSPTSTTLIDALIGHNRCHASTYSGHM